MVGSLLAIAAYLVPGLVVGRIVTRRQMQIRNGLPDALDLVIVCVEAGLSLDQAVLKASEELALSHPALADELQQVTNEIRAGKPRMEAFRNFAERTKVDDVRALVAMLIQTDRFGTSIAQALRTHADTGRIRAPAAGRGARREARGEAGLPPRVLPVSGDVRGHARSGRDPDHPRADSGAGGAVAGRAGRGGASRAKGELGMSTQTLLWIAVVIVGLLYLLKRRSRLRSED